MTVYRPDVNGIVRSLGLAPHPEGGFFREIARDEKIVPGNLAGTARNARTSILFLVPEGGKSRLHRLASDETWNYLSGGPISVIELAKDGGSRRTVIGPAGSQSIQCTVKAGTWFGAVPEPGAGYTLVSCMVSPGFDFSDLEMGNKTVLEHEYPESGRIIAELT